VNVLALDTTEKTGSVAALRDANLLYELRLDSQKRTTQSLTPGIKAVLELVAWQPRDVDLVATTIGPGSFTGLRVGVTTAKAFAYATGAGVLGIDTLEAIAYAAPDHVPALSVAVDAQRGQVVAGFFTRAPDGPLCPVGTSKLVDVDAWLGGLAPGCFVTGPVLRKIAGRVPDHLALLDPQYWGASAAAVGRLAVRRHTEGQRDDIWSLLPRYCRRSAAEEKWEERHG